MKKYLKHYSYELFFTPLLKVRFVYRMLMKYSLISPFHELLIQKGITDFYKKDDSKAEKIFFLRMRFVPRHLMMEIALATDLNKKGALCKFIFCSQILPICNGWDIRSNNGEEICDFCSNNNKLLSSKLPFDSLFLEKFISKDEIKKIDEEYSAKKIRVDDLKNVVIDGINLDDELYLSLAKYLFVGNIEENDFTNNLAMEYYKSGEILVKGISRIIEKERPMIVVLNCGHILWYGIAYKILKLKNIKVISYDEISMSVIKLNWMFDCSNPIVDFNWGELWDYWKYTPLNDDQKSELEVLLETRKKYFLYKEDQDTIPISEKIVNKKFKKVISLFTNVLWDATIVGKNGIFNNLVEWVKFTIDFIENYPEVALIIRVHPAEARLYEMDSKERVIDELSKWREQFKSNIIFIDAEEKIDSYDLINKSDMVLVYASNVGLEALAMNKPVVVCGKPHYIGKNLTIDPQTIEEYSNILNEICVKNIEFSIDETLLKRFLYLAFIDSQIDVDLFSDNHPFNVTELKLDNFIELKKNEMINAISNWVIDKNSRGIITKSRVFLK